MTASVERKFEIPSPSKEIGHEIHPRRMDFVFSEDIGRFWWGQSIFKTQLLNCDTLVLPDAEKYVIGCVKYYRETIENKKLQKETRQFLFQETQHSLEHQKFFENLRKQGYKIDWFLRLIHFCFFKFLNRIFSKKINLAVAAGLEHFTALFADIALGEKVLANAEPKMRALFEWHAVEEIEHKAVAFDVLQTVSRSYLLRIFGIFIASTLIIGFAFLGTGWLLFQDRKLFNPSVWKDVINFMFLKEALFFKAFSIFLEYFNPHFHPWQRDNLILTKNLFPPMGRP